MTDEREAQRAEIKTAWSEAGERLSGLGARLKQHYSDHQGAEQEQSGAEVKEAVKRLGDAVQDAFETFGTAAKDEAVKQDVKEVGQSVASALGATFSVIGDEVRRAFDSTKGSVRGDQSRSEAPDGAPTEGGSADGHTAPPPFSDRPPVQDAPTIADPPITMEEPPPASPEAGR